MRGEENELTDRESSARRRRPAIPWFYAVTSLALALGAGAVGWGLAAYVALERSQSAVADACARVEAAARVQADLVDNLLHLSSMGSRAASGLDAIRVARARVGTGAFPPEILTHPARVAEYRLAHAELDATTKAFWAADPPRDGFLSGLDVKLQRAEACLAADLQVVEERARTYRAAVARFPASVIASIATPEAIRSRATDPSRRATLVPGL
jgi:hypothetical protein